MLAVCSQLYYSYFVCGETNTNLLKIAYHAERFFCWRVYINMYFSCLPYVVLLFDHKAKFCYLSIRFLQETIKFVFQSKLNNTHILLLTWLWYEF